MAIEKARTRCGLFCTSEESRYPSGRFPGRIKSNSFGTRATVFAPSGRETRGVPNLSRVIAKAVINYRYCP